MNSIEAVESWASRKLPAEYVSMLARFGGQFITDRIRFYAANEVIERNETFQSKDYCPGQDRKSVV